MPEQMTNEDLQEFDGREIESQIFPNKKVELFIYPIKSFFKTNDGSKQLLTYSSNVVNIKFIDPDDFQVVDAEIIDNAKFGYVSKQALNSIDNELAIVDSVDHQYSTYQKVKRDPNRLYLVSEIKITNEEQIAVFGQFLQTLTKGEYFDHSESYINQFILETTSFESWKPKDANQIIIKLGKQFTDFEISSIEITPPKSFLIEGLKVLASNNKGLGYGRTTINKDGYIPLWVNPIEISSIGKMRILNLWISDRVFTFKLLKDFIESENKEAFISNLLFLDEKNDDSLPVQLHNVKEIKISIDGYSYNNYPSGDNTVITGPYDFIFDNKGIKKLTITPNSGVLYNGSYDKNNPFKTAVVTSYAGFVAISEFKLNKDSMKNVEVTYDTTIEKSSLINLLLDELTAVYNYSLSFKNAGYVNGDPKNGLNYMALYKQEFEGKKIDEYIDGLDKAWETKNFRYLDTPQYKNFKRIKVMLSKYLFGTNIIGNNANEDSHFLLPFYFNLLSDPVPYKGPGLPANEEDIKKGDAIWKFSSLDLELKSNYFDCSIEKFGEAIISDLSNKNVLNSKDDNFIWQEIRNDVEEAKLPSLRNSDLKISDVNVTKFLVFVNSNFKEYIGSNQEIISDKTFFYKIQEEQIIKINVFDYNKNPKYIELTGIYGSGNYNIKLISNVQRKELIINDVQLFSKDKENICLAKIAF